LAKLRLSQAKLHVRNVYTFAILNFSYLVAPGAQRVKFDMMLFAAV